MRATICALAAATLIAGCASRQEQQLTTSLNGMGLPRGLSNCTAERVSEQLSGGQMRRLVDFATLLDEDIEQMTVGEIADRFAGLGDNEIVTSLVRAVASCAVSG